MVLLYGRAGRLTATNGGLGPGQMFERDEMAALTPPQVQHFMTEGYVVLRADNSRGPGGPLGPLCTLLRTPGTLSRPSITH